MAAPAGKHPAKRAGRSAIARGIRLSFDLADAKPDEFAERLFSSGNGMVHVKALELARSAAQARLRAHRVELDEREKRVAQAERDAEWWAAWAQASRGEYDAIQHEIAELKQQRDDLRAAIAREAG